jgi:SAM-dependent methyltransferase
VDRIPEPELMLGDAQAQAYASADFAEPHNRFVALLKDRLPDLPPSGVALDLGCGPGDVTRRFAAAFAGWTVDAVDGSPAMLELGRRLTEEAGLSSRIKYHDVVLPADALPRRNYALVLSSSLLHHLRDPAVLWTTIRQSAPPGASVFVMDLLRPASRDDAAKQIAEHAAHEPEILRHDFLASLLAAYRPAEVHNQLRAAGLNDLTVETVTDRHFIVWGTT